MHADMSRLPQRFIYAFGGAGLFLFLTAISGLYGACYSNRHCLNFYSTMVVVMLLAQCALLVGYFADQSWKKKLPHDDTGEAAKVNIMHILLFLALHMHQTFLHVYNLCLQQLHCVLSEQTIVTCMTATQSFTGVSCSWD